MHILSIRPAPPGSGNARARFDVEVSPHLRLFNLLLREVGTDRYRTYAPNAQGRHSASFHPDLAEQITLAAVAALTERAANGSNTQES